MLTAQTVLNHFDVHIFEEYLKDEGSSQKLQMLDYELSEAKKYSAAKYAYILKANEENQPQLIVDGLRPKDSGKNNGDCCILSDELKKVFVENRPFFTRIENNSSGTNFTAGVPIVGSNKEIIGSLVVNESVATVDKITDDVMKSSIPFFVFSGLFVLFSFGIFDHFSALGT